MKEFSVEAVVIKAVDYGESDRILTLLTSSHGLISARARGIRKMTSKNASALQLFCFSDIDIMQSGEHFTVKTSSLKQSFYGVSQRVEGFAAACYFAEIICRFTPDDETSSDILRLFLNALFLLEGQKGKSVTFIKACFECKMLAISGFLREFCGCDVCGSVAEKYIYHFLTDTLYCEDDFGQIPLAEKKHSIPLSKTVADACDFVLRSPVNRFALFSLADGDEASFCAFCERLLLHFAEGGFATLKYFHEVLP